MTEHTPGPWELHGICIVKLGKTQARNICAMTETSAVISEKAMQLNDPAWDEQMQNAHLIAAAPQLLEWIIWLRKNIVTVDTYPHEITINGMTLDAAIAAAKGE